MTKFQDYLDRKWHAGLAEDDNLYQTALDLAHHLDAELQQREWDAERADDDHTVRNWVAQRSQELGGKVPFSELMAQFG